MNLIFFFLSLLFQPSLSVFRNNRRKIIRSSPPNLDTIPEHSAVLSSIVDNGSRVASSSRSVGETSGHLTKSKLGRLLHIRGGKKNLNSLSNYREISVKDLPDTGVLDEPPLPNDLTREVHREIPINEVKDDFGGGKIPFELTSKHNQFAPAWSPHRFPVGIM
jgi:hypothetical protein